MPSPPRARCVRSAKIRPGPGEQKSAREERGRSLTAPWPWPCMGTPSSVFLATSTIAAGNPSQAAPLRPLNRESSTIAEAGNAARAATQVTATLHPHARCPPRVLNPSTQRTRQEARRVQWRTISLHAHTHATTGRSGRPRFVPQPGQPPSRLRARGAPEAKNGTVSLVLTDGISLIGTRRENQKFPVVPDAVCSSKSDTSTCK